jgi:hypothetical protein
MYAIEDVITTDSFKDLLSAVHEQNIEIRKELALLRQSLDFTKLAIIEIKTDIKELEKLVSSHDKQLSGFNQFSDWFWKYGIRFLFIAAALVLGWGGFLEIKKFLSY